VNATAVPKPSVLSIVGMTHLATRDASPQAGSPPPEPRPSAERSRHTLRLGPVARVVALPVVVQLLAAFAVTIVLAILVPGAIALSDGVLHAHQVEAKLLAGHVHSGHTQAARVAAWRTEEAHAKSFIVALDQAVARELAGPAHESLDALIRARQYYQDGLARVRRGLTIVGFLESRVTYYFVAALFGMLTHLAFSLGAGFARPPRSLVVLTAAVAYVLWMGPGWARNLMPDDVRRSIFSYVHLDVSWPSFLWQELLGVLLAFMIAWSWLYWSKVPTAVADELERWRGIESEASQVCERADYVGRLLDAWQLHTLLLALAFLPWTLFYWRSASAFSDSRYYLSAGAAHLIWGMSLLCISTPAFVALRGFRLYQQRVAAALAEAPEGSPERGRREYALSVEPVAMFRIALTGTASFITFVAPFVPALAALLA
jgi:hypothetical protein